MDLQTTRNDLNLDHIERNILIMTIILTIGAFFFKGVAGILGAMVGGTLALLNFKLIRRGVVRLMEDRTSQSRRSYVLFSIIKLACFAIVLAGIFFVTKPSLLFFLIGFSLFVPGVMWETLNFSRHNDYREETSRGR